MLGMIAAAHLAMAVAVPVGSFVAITLLVVFFSGLFNRNLGAPHDHAPVRHNRTGLGRMLKRTIEGLNYLIWWIFGNWFRVDEVVQRRLRLVATGQQEPDADPDAVPSHCWAKRYEKIYDLLGILNHKAEALMVYSGVTLAVVSVANIHKEACQGWLCCLLPDEKKFSIIIACFILVSIVFCLIVVGIFWGFLEYAIQQNQPGQYTNHYKDEWDRLLKVVVVRQFFYQFAWLLSVIAWVLLVIFVFSFGL
jgi:hypothetical protein